MTAAPDQQDGTPGPDEAAERAAAAVRRLGHALAGRQAADDVLTRVAEVAEALAADLEVGPPRDKHTEMAVSGRLAEFTRTGRWPGPVPDGSAIDFDRRSLVGGPLNPFAMGSRYERRGDEVRCLVTLGPAFEGPPGRAHGGVVAALIDETMAALMPVLGVMAFTGRLAIDLLAAAPLGVELELRAWLARREGRRLHVSCEGRAGEVVFTRAEGTFIEQDPARIVAAMGG